MSKEIKYAWCGYWNGICKAVFADIPERKIDTGEEIDRWICEGADMLRRLPIDIAKEELKL